jgi:hypothetical protein
VSRRGDEVVLTDEGPSLIGDDARAVLTLRGDGPQGSLSLELPAPYAHRAGAHAPEAHRPAQAPRGRHEGVLPRCGDTCMEVADGLICDSFHTKPTRLNRAQPRMWGSACVTRLIQRAPSFRLGTPRAARPICLADAGPRNRRLEAHDEEHRCAASAGTPSLCCARPSAAGRRARWPSSRATPATVRTPRPGGAPADHPLMGSAGTIAHRHGLRPPTQGQSLQALMGGASPTPLNR